MCWQPCSNKGRVIVRRWSTHVELELRKLGRHGDMKWTVIGSGKWELRMIKTTTTTTTTIVIDSQPLNLRPSQPWNRVTPEKYFGHGEGCVACYQLFGCYNWEFNTTTIPKLHREGVGLLTHDYTVPPKLGEFEGWDQLVISRFLWDILVQMPVHR